MAKQKQNKKPAARKPRKQNAKAVRKVTRRKRKTVHPVFDTTKLLDIEQVYKAINKVQLTREAVMFAVAINDAAVVENILKDVTLKFTKTTTSEAVVYAIQAPPEQLYNDAFEDLDEYPDEIIEDGQVF
jgi:hypothetical protein